jgi:integrase
MSDTGKLRRRYFTTRDLAKAESQRLRAIAEGRKDKSALIRPGLAEDAVTAEEILHPFGVTLAQAARFYAAHHDARAAAPLLSAAWDSALARRPNHRSRTLLDLRNWRKALPGWLMAMNIRDIEPNDIAKALDETTKGKTTRKNGRDYIRTVLGDCVKDRTLDDNPAARVHIERKPDTSEEVSTYTPDELKKLMAACRDYEKGLDKACATCSPAFALMAFAGIRPDEVGKLKWADVSLELHNIRIGPSVAKKARRRNVRIQPTLAAWLETVPPEKRHGKVAPPRWIYKATRVRKEAGIDGHEKQDALRHSFGTYLLAVENDLDALKADMGHEHVRVFFDHYHKAVTKREALPYWEVLPPGVKLEGIYAA